MIDKNIKLSINEVIGNRISKKRREQGWTGNQVASLLGISQQQFSRYERGRNQISVYQLMKISRILNTSINWFFDDYEKIDSSTGEINLKLRKKT
ncbi:MULTISPECIES: helix-turn-helix domain-containing protein [Proteus]|uniref:Helix-turn-helix transcriptional regulator n=1 Tax=Proteus penneri TaxID=102862 RepID=A0ABS0VZD4_9GAMM|nr:MULTISPECIES: helix-turn-helix domain-containing protein [Proteus]EEG83335.1 DNA-binding helix-turn-helix protein [Proteus penneri ATCC 35198]MBJ2116416.1 helix-turn-helix transcriptional regulator [Proteus penneri]NBM13196.1 helix-turn-helix domain-containing protein [Proteus sp. G2670]NBM34347.1 helix-turn-helix domain-containing protein [Proteus sp. G2664]NBM67808.1 helix-turn-helix domain-containing protein [Proteus sp. G2663]